MFAAGGGLGMVALIMATGSLVGALALGALGDNRSGAG